MARIYHTAHKRAKLRNILRSQVTDLILHGHIKLTSKRKDEIKRLFDKLITLAKNGDLHSIREILKVVRKNVKNTQNEHALGKLKTLAIKYKDRKSGYLRIYNLGQRRGDHANLYYLTLI